ncbi:hypothetical protein FKG94_24175 [Exilibacterium tricleocarpae]|uniref:Peptidase C-terminal archaeal/bacterial domain-containing protein n=1 Tax=Exilibacterium tricleocarpae TaxID=2591008 RepID=A0A545STC1_9GAMM|nr:hypothetical protein [Exilibacterium tricleocarpae]TQV68185.1 hypothetical protein FKG94_24175 [Exilibacterium tricleocarpae]
MEKKRTYHLAFYCALLLSFFCTKAMSQGVDISQCYLDIAVGTTVTNTWVQSCTSVNRINNQDPYNPRPVPAKYFTFQLDRDADIRVSITGGFNRHLFLIEGPTPNTTPLLSFQESLIETWLPSGTYTIEATSTSLSNFELELVFNDLGNPECVQPLELGTSIADGWTPNCESQHRDVFDPYGPNPGAPFRAKYFTFSLAEATDISIDIDSTVSTYLYILDGTGEFAPPIQEFNGNYYVTNLSAGDYTIELTTVSRYAPGQFVIDVQPRGLQTVCEKELVPNSTIVDEWSAGCPILSWMPDPNDPYAGINPERANYYTFSSQEPQDFNFIRLFGDSAVLLNLYEAGNFNQTIASTRTTHGSPSNGFDIRLDPGSYALEVTAYDELAIGQYSFRANRYNTSACQSNIALGDTFIQGLIAEGCDSLFRFYSGNGDPYGPQPGNYYAKQFAFTLTEPRIVRAFTFLQSQPSYLYLAKQESPAPLLLTESFPENDFDVSRSQTIVRELDAGDYLLEITTQYPQRESRFRLDLGQSTVACDRFIRLSQPRTGTLSGFGSGPCLSMFKAPIFNNDPYGPNHGLQYFYAQSYTFEVDTSGDYQIKTTSTNLESHLFLVEGPNIYGDPLVDQAQVLNGENTVNIWLEPGYYTVEVTSKEVQDTGAFVLSVTPANP